MPNASSLFSRSTWLGRIWHFPEKCVWMSPLPVQHRRGIMLALLVILIAVLWPTSGPQHVNDNGRTGHLDNEIPLQAELVAPNTAETSQNQQWHIYSVADGQTLAQLFRDHNLPVNDLFAMAQVEGDGKPLSTVHAGQQVKIRQNSAGEVTGLALTTSAGELLFTRQANGAFLRVQ